MNSLDDKRLIIKYVESYYKFILIIPIVIILFIIANYPDYGLFPQYIFSEPYRGPAIIFGFMLFIVSSINLKHGIVTSFNKDFAHKSAFWGIFGALRLIFNKQLLIEGTVIRYRGLSAKIISYLS